MSFPVQAPMAPVPGLPPYTEAYVQRGRRLLVVLVWVAAVVGVAGSIALAVFTSRAGSGLVLLYALIPAVTLVAGYVWLDRYEPEPRRYVAAAFVWGAVISTSSALALQIGASSLFDLSDEAMATWIAPVTEEPAKCLFLLLTFVRARRVIDGFVDGLVYAGIVGLGFAFVENVGYISIAYDGLPTGEDGPQLDGVGGATATFVVRGLFSPLAHPLFTSSFGIAIALALTLRSPWLRGLVCAVGLAGSMGLHALWNGSLSYGGGLGFLFAYLALAAVLAGLVTCAILARARQGKRVRLALEHMAGRGWLHRDEVPYLSRFPMRARAVAFAKAQPGDTALPAFRRYQRLAASAAFLYAGVMDGRGKRDAVGKVDAMRWAMGQVKPWVRLPPPVRPVVPGWGYGPPPGYGPPARYGPPPGYGPPQRYGPPPGPAPYAPRH